jgi:hypothetical protein
MLRSLTYLTFVSIILFRCSSKPNDQEAVAEPIENDTAVSNLTEPAQGPYLSTAESYRDELDKLPVNSKAILTGLELFETSFPKENKDANDKALYYYLLFQGKIIAKLDEELAGRRDANDVNSLAYGDSTVKSKTARSYVQEMDKNGLKFGSTEGFPFVKPKLEIVKKYFYPALNASTQSFFDQYTIQSDQELSSDAGIIIPIQELAERVLFWDEFVSRYPSHTFSEHATREFKINRYYLMAGMENTPAYDYETKKLDREFANAFEFIITKHPASSSADVLKNLMTILVKNDTTKTEEAEEFISKYSPY